MQCSRGGIEYVLCWFYCSQPWMQVACRHHSLPGVVGAHKVVCVGQQLHVYQHLNCPAAPIIVALLVEVVLQMPYTHSTHSEGITAEPCIGHLDAAVVASSATHLCRS